MDETVSTVEIWKWGKDKIINTVRGKIERPQTRVVWDLQHFVVIHTIRPELKSLALHAYEVWANVAVGKTEVSTLYTSYGLLRIARRAN